ncbi:MAG: hypothetical protein MUC99_07200 [Anaerolineae bacterium]|nr:hypothetical protein [Anaerolineae bacterium]
MQRLNRIRHLWTIQDPVAIWVRLAPDLSMQTVEQSTLPSVKRLHLREAFANGRRYDVFKRPDGFVLASSALTGWNGRQRASAACTLHVHLTTDADHAQTTLTVHAHLRPFAVLNALWLPTLMVYLIGSNPWPQPAIVFVIVSLYALAWASLRLSAAVDAADMTYFLQKTFEEFQHIQPQVLAAPPDPNAVNSADFEQMWERFVQARRAEYAD